MIRLFLLLMVLIYDVSAYEYAETFVVKMFDKKVRVLAPEKYSPNLGVIIENKTLVYQLGRIETLSGKRLATRRVAPNGTEVVDLKKIDKNDRIFFVPLAPAFQSVELKFGRTSYEIPPKR